MAPDVMKSATLAPRGLNHRIANAGSGMTRVSRKPELWSTAPENTQKAIGLHEASGRRTLRLMGESLPAPPPEFDELTVEQQISYVQSLWQRIAANVDEVPVPDWHARELDRRLVHSTNATRPWSEVRAELVAKYSVPR